MPQSNQHEGNVPFTVPNIQKECFTWYKIFGELQKGTVPLIGVHGGPGAGHEYLLKLADLWTQHNIPVILYDQIGCGNSTLLPEKGEDESFWTVDLFERELDNLVQHLGVKTFDFLGHSWGGMLGVDYASRELPSGLRKLILMGTPVSIELLHKASANLRAQLPAEAQETLSLAEREGKFDSEEYQTACLQYYKRFLCRLEEWPEQLTASLGHLDEGPVYKTMWGPSELTCNGGLRDWTAINKAHRIRQPTLLVHGEFDEIGEQSCAPLFELIPKIKWVILPNSSHMGMWEEPDRFRRVIAGFLQ